MNPRSALVTARFDDTQLDRLRAAGVQPRKAGFGVTGQALPAGELATMVADVQILISEFEMVDSGVLAAAPSLEVIGCCRNEPHATVDIAAATARGVPVLYTPGRNAISVAEYTVGLLIALARHIGEAHHLLRHTGELTERGYSDTDMRRDAVAQWSLDPDGPFARFQGPEISGRVAGLVGLGTIGRAIAVRCRALGMSVIGYDPYQPDTVFRAAGVTRHDLLDLAAKCDFLIAAAKVTPQSRGLISHEVLAALHRHAYVVNTARAALMDYVALEDALRRHQIAGAALDVFPSEPLEHTSGLRDLPNVLLSPHLAGASRDIPRHHSQILTDDILRLLSGQRPRALANSETWGLTATGAGS